jgi:hypothetical protein
MTRPPSVPYSISGLIAPYVWEITASYRYIYDTVPTPLVFHEDFESPPSMDWTDMVMPEMTWARLFVRNGIWR